MLILQSWSRWLAALMTPAWLCLVTVRPVQAASVVFEFKKISDGVLPFDPNDTPGNDSGSANNRVRTLDTITYQWQYAANDGDSTNVVLRATVPAEQEFAALPPACQAGSGIVDNSDGSQTVTCNIGTIVSGSSGAINLQGRILGQRRSPIGTFVGNGQTTSATGSLQADSTPIISNNTPVVTISARPKADLAKDSAWVEGTALDPSGNRGFVIRYPITIAVTGSGKGSEALVGNISFTDTLINRSTNQPVSGVRLYNWATDGHSGCNWMGGDSYSWYSGYPHGRQGVNGIYGTPTRSVKNSGTWSCSQSSAGQPITFNITGADTTGNSVPSQSYNAVTLPSNRSYLVSGTLHLWVPLTAVTTSATGQLNVRNQVSDLTTTGASGQANLEPNFVNNYYDHTLVGVNGSFTSYYHEKWTTDSRWTPLPGMSAIYGGDGVIMPNQKYSSRLYLHNNGALPWDDAILCQTIDNKTQQFDSSLPVRDLSYGLPSTSYVIEYGTGEYADVTAQARGACRDGTVDSPDGWFTNINSVPGGPDRVTKVRVRSVGSAPVNAVWDVVLNLKMRNTYLDTTTQIPIGTVVSQHSSFYIKDYPYGIYNGGNFPAGWRGNYYNINTNTYAGWGDRLRVTRAIVRIKKENVPNVEVKPVLASGRTQFTIKSSVTAPINPAPVSPNVVIRDELPATLRYVTGSASIIPTNIINNVDGTTTLIWDLGLRVPNQVVPDITFSVDVRPDAADNSTILNTAVIESPDDASLASVRTDQASLLVGNAAAFRIFKEVEKVLVEKEEAIVFNLFYANTGSSDVGSSRFIDILPTANLNRIPATIYNGSLSYQNITGSHGETFKFTSRPALQIDVDPDAASNGASGGTVWCTTAQFGSAGCPSSNSDVTAILITTQPFPRNNPTRKLRMTLQPTSNSYRNVYTNNFTGRTDGLLGLLQSNDSFARVAVPANLVLVKRITAVNGVDLPQVVDDTGSSNDNDSAWPSNYLRGALNGGRVKPGDVIEYTIYYLSNGDRPVDKVLFCDLVPQYTTYISNGFQGSTPLALNAIPGADIGLRLDKEGTIQYLTSLPNDDVGTALAAGASTGSYTCTAPNTNGAVVVNMGRVPHSGYGGDPSKAYGLIRFRARVR